jgi:hypothetical protein
MSKTGYIYKLVCNDINIKECYVGSTTNMKVRKHSHKERCVKKTHEKYHYYVYHFIRSNGSWDNWSMIQLEDIKFNTRNELLARERHWFEVLNSKLNKKKPAGTKKEYYQNNKDKWATYNDKKNNENYIKYHKNYYIKNRASLDLKNKQHYEKNKEYITQLTECENCCSSVRKNEIPRHKKTKKCQFAYQFYCYIYS